MFWLIVTALAVLQAAANLHMAVETGKFRYCFFTVLFCMFAIVFLLVFMKGG